MNCLFRNSRLIAVCLSVVLFFCSVRPAISQSATVADVDEKPDVEQSVSFAKALSTAFRHAAERVSPAVVTILAGDTERSVGRFGRSEMDDETSVGSGIVISRQGIVLTNNHVISGARSIIVRLNDGREYDVDRIQTDEYSDIAVLHINNPPELTAAKIGDSDELQIGDWVIAIGSPFELESTVSAGIISGKGRGLRKIKRGKLLQTDAAINPGNSGGPLVNLDGEVVGINTAIASSSGGYQGIGFAIPSNQVRWVVGQLLQTGVVKRSYLGVEIDDLIPREARRRGLPAISGVLVSGIRPDSPAEDAGLQPDDVILEIAGRRVSDSRDLQGIVERLPAGSRQPMRVIRQGIATEVFVTLRAMSGE